MSDPDLMLILTHVGGLLVGGGCGFLVGRVYQNEVSRPDDRQPNIVMLFRDVAARRKTPEQATAALEGQSDE